ncbi:hypothetical protein [Puia dinghuensis]|uniref:hypothetical protein n=1 Tax=Puia dinghuensis TaxID=1792502 RepID=UPI00166A0301|nr:hypothetical protein [Puia dinghuensis]
MLSLSGNDQEAANVVAALIESFEFAAVYLGSLSTGGKLQQAKGPPASFNLIQL